MNNMAEATLEKNYHYFMEADVSPYIGEWIAILENNVISHGKSLKEVVRIANTISKGRKFLLARVPSEETMIF